MQLDRGARISRLSRVTRRCSSIEEHISFIAQLGLVDRLPTPVHGPGSQLLGPEEEAARFAERWFGSRWGWSDPRVGGLHIQVTLKPGLLRIDVLRCYAKWRRHGHVLDRVYAC